MCIACARSYRIHSVEICRLELRQSCAIESSYAEACVKLINCSCEEHPACAKQAVSRYASGTRWLHRSCELSCGLVDRHLRQTYAGRARRGAPHGLCQVACGRAGTICPLASPISPDKLRGLSMRLCVVSCVVMHCHGVRCVG